MSATKHTVFYMAITKKKKKINKDGRKTIRWELTELESLESDMKLAGFEDIAHYVRFLCRTHQTRIRTQKKA